MKIVSKFHDYYDSVQAYGIDSNLTYVRSERHPETVSLNVQQFISDHNSGFDLGINLRRHSVRLIPIIVGFCGNVYLAVRLYSRCYCITDHQYKVYNKVCYTFEQYVDALKELHAQNFLSKRDYVFALDCSNNIALCKKTYYDVINKNTFNDFNNSTNKCLQSLFVEFNSPIFVILPSEYQPHPFHPEYSYKSSGSIVEQQDVSPFCKCVIIDCKLSDFHFQRHSDAFTVSQEISMFLTSVLPSPTKVGTTSKKRPVDWIDPINSDNFSDTVKRDAKGFDVNSFKKAPNKKTKRRKHRKPE